MVIPTPETDTPAMGTASRVVARKPPCVGIGTGKIQK